MLAVTLCLSILVLSGCRSNGGVEVVDDLGPVEILDGDYPLSAAWGENPGNIVQGVYFENVYFEFDSSRIARSERSKIEAVADHLGRNTGHRALLVGHCDERGSGEYNMALGERRALAARAYLIGLGIDPSRVLTKSYGEEQPEDPGHHESSWRLNRRADFVIYE